LLAQQLVVSENFKISNVIKCCCGFSWITWHALAFPHSLDSSSNINRCHVTFRNEKRTPKSGKLACCTGEAMMAGRANLNQSSAGWQFAKLSSSKCQPSGMEYVFHSTRKCSQNKAKYESAAI